MKRSAVDLEDLKPYWKSEKGHISLSDQQSYYLQVFQRLFLTERRLTGWYFLAVDLSPTFLNTGSTNETFQQSGKQDSFRHILKSSASMYENSGSQFFATTTGIQSGLDTFDESRFIMTLTILGVT